MSEKMSISGTWHYRSFRNLPNTVTNLSDLLFGEASLTFSDPGAGLILGIGDFGDGDTMSYRGSISYGDPVALRFRGLGTGKTNIDWIYDYVGYLVPFWPYGVDQRPAIVGSVVRAAPHSIPNSKQTAPAGSVASFIAVRAE